MRSLLPIAALVALGVPVIGCPGPGAVPAPPPPGRPSPLPRAGSDAASPQARLHAALQQNLRKSRNKLLRCFRIALAEDYRIGGAVALALTVSHGGIVTAVKTIENEPGSAFLATCLDRAARDFPFPETGAERRVMMRLRFPRPQKKLTVGLDEAPVRTALGKGIGAKLLLSPRTVSGDRLSLVALRLLPGAAVPLVRHTQATALWVLKGEVRITGDGRPLTLATGSGGVIAPGRAHRVACAGTTSATLLLFFGPSGPERWLASGKPGAGTTPLAGRRPVATPIPLVRSSGGPVPASGPVALPRAPLPTPMEITLRAGAAAVFNPRAAPVDTAVFVLEGALWLTLAGEKLAAGPGTAVYLPGPARVPARTWPQADARVIVWAWPRKTSWSTKLTFEVLKR